MSEESTRRSPKEHVEEAAPAPEEPGSVDHDSVDHDSGDHDDVSVDVNDARDVAGYASVESGDRAADETGTAEAGESATVTLSADEHARFLEAARERQVYLDELRRVKADFENYQKRVRRERPSWEAQAVRGFVQDFLSFVDNFERALQMTESSTLESLSEGVRMIYQMVVTTLEDHGVKAIDALGQPFDPAFHEAMSQMETDDAEQDGKIIEVHQKGYLHGNIVIRPARVVVGRRRPEVPEALGDDDPDTPGEVVDPPENACEETGPE